VPTTVSRKATRRRRPAGPRDDGAGEREREESSSVGGEGEASGVGIKREESGGVEWTSRAELGHVDPPLVYEVVVVASLHAQAAS
jgi:hypothetical protein